MASAEADRDTDTGDDLVVHLTAMRRRHLRHVLRIEREVYPRPWSLGLFLSELSMRSTRLYLVARIAPTVVGYAGLMLIVGEGHVATLAVDPAWHRRGIGTRLLLALARGSIDRGATALTLEVRVSNTAAQGLYRTFGFAPAGIRKNYYSDANEDAIIMWAHDVAGDAYARRLDDIEASIPGVTVMEVQLP
ncbi:MAG: ribosomal protein S18-alanine N-acetyltransferase [Acidimicrobiales bacterium]